jgi:putative oxidoreductase
MNTSVMSLIRYLVAYVFIISGIMKIFSHELSNYFINLGLPSPITLMYIVALIEIICAIFILMNRQVRAAVIPLFMIMIAAFLLTKVPVLHTGFLAFAFQARLDIIMLVLLFILYNRYPYNR